MNQMDFYTIKTKKQSSNNRNSDIIVYPDFRYAGIKDLVCKGGQLYAFWMDGKWHTDLDLLIVKIDQDIRAKKKEIEAENPHLIVAARYFNDNESNIRKAFEQYTGMMKQSEIAFNTTILFSEDIPEREDYSTNQLDYTPTEGPTEAFDEMFDLLYKPEELDKILWFMGALLTNNMARIQKFIYLYGGKGAGKGTIIKIFKKLFKGYFAPIDLMTLTGGSEFATAQIQELPLLIDDDSDMSRIAKDVNLLKLTAHEPLNVNAKYKQTYDVVFNGLLLTASNQRFQVRNIDSGITRRAVVVMPTSFTHEGPKYQQLMSKIDYEIPAIANKAIDTFNRLGINYYDDYMDVEMAEATDYIFSFVRESYPQLGDPVSLKKASELFRVYLEDLGYDTKGYKRRIKNELMRYYREFKPKVRDEEGWQRNIFSGFKMELVYPEDVKKMEPQIIEDIELKETKSVFDSIAKDYQAQYTTKDGTPKEAWDDCETVLEDLNTHELHFVRLPSNHIVIDFDLKVKGEKNLEKNLKAASNFPKTYTELSKSGQGVHLHYIYDGEPSELAPLYSKDIEVKVFTGKQSLRRKLTLCNESAIAHISSGLPIKEEEIKLYKSDEKMIWTEQNLRTTIKGNLAKQYHSATKPSIDFIGHILNDAKAQGLSYDVTDLRQDIMVFASRSSNNAQYCIAQAIKFPYMTMEETATSPAVESVSTPLILPDEDLYFVDVEVFPNVLIIVYKKYGSNTKITLINPTPREIEEMLKHPLVGFNNRGYDNHIIYGALIGMSNLELFKMSSKIVNNQGGKLAGAYDLSYTDIYEYSSKKQSLKKWEIEMGVTHDELEFPWDQPLDESNWTRAALYCGNDVDATESLFDYIHYDYDARKILSTLSGLPVNATTTQQAARVIFGPDLRPQDKFIYTDLSKIFPGYKFEFGKSIYRGEDPGEGGYVYSEPGVYKNVVLLDVESMHPNSSINMNYFGPYTQRYKELVQVRIHIKHGEYDKAKKLFNGVLAPFLNNEKEAKQLSYALKIIINIVYGMTSAKFDNAFKHPKNIDNIVAKRGALFMINLKHEVQDRGYKVVHIKTDSIKIADADQEIIDFVSRYGKEYGYNFQHEATYSRMALINKAVYIAQYGWHEEESKIGKWEATGAQFADPYVYKKLFSKEPIEEKDYALVKQVKTAIYLDQRFVGKVAQVYASVSGKTMYRKKDDKFDAVTGTKGYLWNLFSEYKGFEDIDMQYYDNLLQSAVDAIDKVGSAHEMLDDAPKHLVTAPF